VELEPAVEVVPEALAQLIAGPEGHGALVWSSSSAAVLAPGW
jgi:hypothetical protein